MVELLTDNIIVHDIVALYKPALFNVYFTVASVPLGFLLAALLALMKLSQTAWISQLASGYIYALRGSPLLIQLFMIYSLLLAFNVDYWKPMGIDHIILNPLFLGPLVLTLNTSAYCAEIFHGAILAVPKDQIDAAMSLGMGKTQTLRTIVWPNMIRLSWPAYTNELVFLFHATAIIYYVLPVVDDQKDLMNKAGELFEKDYNVFLHYSVAAVYFLAISMVIMFICEKFYKRMTKHLCPVKPMSLKLDINYLR